MKLFAGALLALIVLAPGVGASAQARDPRPIVLVVDPGRARMSSDRLLRAIAAATEREVVRITDERARDPIGTLTIAYEAPTRWLVRYESRGRSASAHERIARPGALHATLAAAAARLFAELDAAPATTSAPPPPPRPRDDRTLYVAWADEILDPFAGLPPPPRREVAIYSEVLDPFAPAAARRVVWTEVVDPWDR